MICVKIFITAHAAQRALERRISIDDIIFCMEHGKRTWRYPIGTCECSIKVRKPKGRLCVILDRTRTVIITVYRKKYS